MPFWQRGPYEELLQSALPPHPHTPLLHLVPSGEPEQSAAQVPPEQQPPLQSADALHDVEQVPPLQAMPVGQSPAALHPQVPPLRHLLPVEAVEQSTQVPPDGAHAPLPTGAHCPDLQQ